MSAEKILLTEGSPTMLLFTTKQQNKWNKHLNNLNSESLKVGLKIHKGKTKYMTNHEDSEDILIDQKRN